MAKIRVRETFEQGLDRKHGGRLKLYATQVVEVQPKDGDVVQVGDRTVPKAIYEAWHAGRLVELLSEA